MSSTGIAVTAIVVAYKQTELLTRSLQTLQRALAAVGEPTELIVVDNSAGAACDRVRDVAPLARIIALERNIGFAGGVQRGIDAAAGEWVLLLNDDAEIAQPAVNLLLRAGRSAPCVGSVAAQMRFASSPMTINSSGIEVDRLGVAVDRLVGHPVDEGGHDVCEVFGASAGAALYRSAMLRDVGGFDVSFFAYLEDVDLAWRARIRGWTALHVPAAVVLHAHSATSGHGSAFKWRLVGRNRMRLLAKNATTSQLLRNGPRLVLHEVAYVTYVAARSRSLAPLWGRLEGLREWRRYRRAGAAHRRDVKLVPAAGLAAALQRNRSWKRFSVSITPPTRARPWPLRARRR